MDWYTEVKKIMDDYGVPEPVWVGAARAESGLNPHPNIGDSGSSFGLFQINVPGNKDIPGITTMSREQLEDIHFQAQTMAPRFASGWREAQNKGLTGPAAYNYAAWTAEKPYGFPYDWGLTDYSKRTGIITTNAPGMGDVKISESKTGTTTIPSGATSQKSWLEEKAGLSANWKTNAVLGLVGGVALIFGIWGLMKQEGVQ